MLYWAYRDRPCYFTVSFIRRPNGCDYVIHSNLSRHERRSYSLALLCNPGHLSRTSVDKSPAELVTKLGMVIFAPMSVVIHLYLRAIGLHGIKANECPRSYCACGRYCNLWFELYTSFDRVRTMIHNRFTT